MSNENAISDDVRCLRRLKVVKSMNISNKLTNEIVNNGNEAVYN